MRRALLLFLTLSLVFSLFGCTKSRTHESPKNPNALDPSDPMPSLTAKRDSFEADFMHYFLSPTTKYEVFVFERGGKFGVVDHEGNVLVEPTYDFAELTHTANSFSEWEGAEIRVLLSAANENGSPSMEGEFVNADGTLTHGSYAGWGYDISYKVVWDESAGEALLVKTEGGDCTTEPFKAENYYRPVRKSRYYFAKDPQEEKVILVQAISDYTVTSDGEFVPTLAEDGKYALLEVETGKLLTGFDYLDYDRMGEICGIVAAKKDGGWGYLNSAGVELTEFRYTPCYYDTDSSGNEIPRFYPANGRFLVVKEGEVFGVAVTDDRNRIALVPAYTGITIPTEDGWYWRQNADGTWSCQNLYN